jgi:phage repressor protein C with HTH and peptisase S24 domain
MLRHEDIWRAIDQLAKERGFSPSGLARRAGLDPTTFNKSKRVARDGRPRWPSTESIAKILEATGASFAELVTHVGGAPVAGAGLKRLPLLRLADAGAAGQFDASGYPAGTGWDEQLFPDLVDPHAYALEIGGDAYLPVYRDGDMIVASPQASMRRGDRIVVRMADGAMMIRQLVRRGGRKLEIAGLIASQGEVAIPNESVAFVHRIVWASQ